MSAKNELVGLLEKCTHQSLLRYIYFENVCLQFLGDFHSDCVTTGCIHEKIFDNFMLLVLSLFCSVLDEFIQFERLNSTQNKEKTILSKNSVTLTHFKYLK